MKEKKTAYTPVKLQPSLRLKLEQMAKQQGVTLSALIRSILNQGVNHG